VVELRAEVASQGSKPDHVGQREKLAVRPGSGGAGEEERGEKLTGGAHMSVTRERGDVARRRNP
jgi:hypothetical protein